MFLDSASARGTVRALKVFWPHKSDHPAATPDTRSAAGGRGPGWLIWGRFGSEIPDMESARPASGMTGEVIRWAICIADYDERPPSGLQPSSNPAACATRRSIWVVGFAVTGLADERGSFHRYCPYRAARCPRCPVDWEMNQRVRNPSRLLITSSVLTSHACLDAFPVRRRCKGSSIGGRDHAKARPRRLDRGRY
jgi:hypothetical protein